MLLTCEAAEQLLHRPLRVSVPAQGPTEALEFLGHTVTEEEPDVVLSEWADVDGQVNDVPSILAMTLGLRAAPAGIKHYAVFRVSGAYVHYLSQHQAEGNLDIYYKQLPFQVVAKSTVLPTSQLEWVDAVGRSRQEHLKQVIEHGLSCLSRMRYVPAPPHSHRPSLPAIVQWSPGKSKVVAHRKTVRVSHDCLLHGSTDQDLIQMFYAGYDVASPFFASLVPALYYALAWQERRPGARCLQDIPLPLLKLPAILPGQEASCGELLSLVVAETDADLDSWTRYTNLVERVYPGTTVTTLVVGNFRFIGHRLPAFKWSTVPVHVLKPRDDHWRILSCLETAATSATYNARSLSEIYGNVRTVMPVPGSDKKKRKIVPSLCL